MNATWFFQAGNAGGGAFNSNEHKNPEGFPSTLLIPSPPNYTIHSTELPHLVSNNLKASTSFNQTRTDPSPFSSFFSMNLSPPNRPARPATTPVSSSQFSPPQQAAVPVCPGSNYPSNHPVAPIRPPPRIRPASTSISAVRPGPPGRRRSAAGAGPSRVSPYNTTNAALAARQAAEARRAREFNPDYLVYPTPTRSSPPVPAPDRINPNGLNNPAAAATAPSPARPPQPQNLPVQPRPITEAEARQAENAAHLERSLAAIAQIEQRAREYCDLDPAAGFQFDPPPRR